MSEPRQSPEEVTQNLPRFPPRPTDTAPLYPADELMKLQSIMDNRQGQLPVPPPPRKRPTWVGKALALVGVAVVSGFVWWVLQPSDPVDQPVAQPQRTAGEFEFTTVPQLPEPVKDSDCAAHATSQTQAFFKTTPCLQLTRAFYTAKLPDGRTVYSSVSVVKMRSADEARRLRELTQKDGTGNVKDLVLDKAISVPPLTTLANGGYASEQRDQVVVIVESDSPVKSADALAHNKEMKKVSNDAIRLASSFAN